MLWKTTVFFIPRSPNHVLTLWNTIHGRKSNKMLNNKSSSKQSTCNQPCTKVLNKRAHGSTSLNGSLVTWEVKKFNLNAQHKQQMVEDNKTTWETETFSCAELHIRASTSRSIRNFFFFFNTTAHFTFSPTNYLGFGYFLSNPILLPLPPCLLVNPAKL